MEKVLMRKLGAGFAVPLKSIKILFKKNQNFDNQNFIKL